MNKFYSFAAMSLLAAAGLVAQGVSEASSITPSALTTASVQVDARTGADLISSLRKNYESGAYEKMLAGLDSEYQKMVQEGRFQEFSQMREIPSMNADEVGFSARWEALSQQLMEERNVELKEISNEGDALLKKHIDSVTTPLSREHKDALQYLSSLRSMSPEKAANADEKRLVEIDLISEFKILHLESQSAALPSNERIENQIVLKMDMLKQMQKSSESFKDQELKKKINAAVEASDVVQARFWDLNQLKAMAKKPSNDVEKKLASTLSSHKTKESDLYRNELAKISKK